MADSDDFVRRLEKLAELRAAGILSEDEFSSAKSRLLEHYDVRPQNSVDDASEDPSPQAAASSQAGWYPDPGGTPQVRYFDGAAWSEDVRPADAPPQDVVGPGKPTGETWPPATTWPPPRPPSTPSREVLSNSPSESGNFVEGIQGQAELPPNIRDFLKQYDEHAQLTCLECGYSGLIGVDGRTKPWWATWLGLVALGLPALIVLTYFFPGPGFVWGILLGGLWGLSGRQATRATLTCPSCRQELSAKID